MEESTSLKYNRRDAIAESFEVVEDETGLPPTGITFTGGWFTVKRRKTDADAAAVFQTAVIMDSTTKGRFKATEAQMDVAPGRYFYDVQLTSPQIGSTTILNDTFTVVQDVTARTT